MLLSEYHQAEDINEKGVFGKDVFGNIGFVTNMIMRIILIIFITISSSIDMLLVRMNGNIHAQQSPWSATAR